MKEKDHTKYKKKEWYEKNKIRIKCICGADIIQHNIKNHLKTKKHLDYEKKPKDKEKKEIIYKSPFITKNKIRWS